MAVILLTNDDGPGTPGLLALAEALRVDGMRVRVVVPDRQRSGAGHSITLFDELRVRRHEMPGCDAFAASGTPADCVKLALAALWEDPPDLVVSGVNGGANVGINVFYSGTVGAVLEGLVSGVPGVAVSVDVEADRPTDFAAAARYGLRIIRAALDNHMPGHAALNVNVPNLAVRDILGTRITRQGRSGYRERYVPEGREGRYRVEGDLVIQPDESPEHADGPAVRAGWVSVTPLTISAEHRVFSSELARWKDPPW